MNKSLIIRAHRDRVAQYVDKRAVIAVCVILVGWLQGCASSGMTPLNYSVRRELSAEPAALLDAAEIALLQLGYAVDVRNTSEGMLQTVPIELDEMPLSEEALLQLSSPRKLRKVASVRVQSGATDTDVFCKVEIQELATEAYRITSLEQGDTDMPIQTAIERDAAVSEEQTTVWRMIRRDRPAERAILAAIDAQLAP